MSLKLQLRGEILLMPFFSFWKEASKQQNQVIIDYIVCDLIFAVINNIKGKLYGEFGVFLLMYIS